MVDILCFRCTAQFNSNYSRNREMGTGMGSERPRLKDEF